MDWRMDRWINEQIIWYCRDCGNCSSFPLFFLPLNLSVELCQLTDGRVISPIPKEMAVKNLLPFVGHCFACGHNRPYLVILFTCEVTVKPIEHQTKSYLQIRREENWQEEEGSGSANQSVNQ